MSLDALTWIMIGLMPLLVLTPVLFNCIYEMSWRDCAWLWLVLGGVIEVIVLYFFSVVTIAMDKLQPEFPPMSGVINALASVLVAGWSWHELVAKPNQ